MKFKGWKPPGSTGPNIRYYDSDNSGLYIAKEGGSLSIFKGNASQRAKANIVLVENDIILSQIGLTQLNKLMKEKGLVANNYSPRKNNNSKRFSSNENVVHGHFNLDTRNNHQINQETQFQDVSSAPFKSSTSKNGFIIVDTREPEELFKKVSLIDIDNIQYANLPLGDILIGDTRNKDVLLIERKTITDLTASIKSNHAHDQAVRYFEESQKMAKLGYQMKVMWIVEGEGDGSRMLYNALPKAVQMDGWLNFIDPILDQSTVQSYNLNHTAYLIAKFAQGFIEKQLYYKVQAGNPLINKVHKKVISVNNEMEGDDKGVTRAENNLASMLSYIPAIKRNVATELSALGLSFSEITRMSIDELKKVKGIGKITAQEIYDDFNKK